MLGVASAATAALAGCSSDETTPGLQLRPSGAKDTADAGKAPDASGTGTRPDAGTQTQADAGTSPRVDSGSGTPDAGTGPSGDDASTGTPDAGVDAAPEAGPVAFCAGRPGLAFCADYDEASSLTPGGAGYDAVLSLGANLSLSTGRAVSNPSSLLVDLKTDPGGEAKLVKTVTRPVTEAVYEFDLFLERLPTNAGGFLTDYQFSDTRADGSPAADTFGFRIAIFGDADGKLAFAKLEHNRPALPGLNDDASDLPLAFGVWQHVKFAVAYSTQAGANKVSFQAYLDNAPTPVLDKTFDAPFASAPFARIAQGVVYPFNGGSKDFRFSLDNTTLDLR